MFRCQKCGTVVAANVRSTKIIVASRPRFYEPRGQDPSERRGRVPRFRRGGRRVRKRKPYDKGGQGTEIVRELSVCPKCAAEFAVEAEAAAEAAALEAAQATIVQAETTEAETAETEAPQLETSPLGSTGESPVAVADE